ncbi:YesL family protein [Ruania zhangjianzhongii]|uniref:YesL family protein n=1 Tax=Ruania zhangjianzhongii TaxID=2603206 RepID=UPI00143E09FA|nr:YesL family protein [Ruania zhangjianzhongii]
MLERFWECVGLNTLWVLGCLPVLTAGSSTVALFEVVGQRRRGEYRPIARAYWAGFRRAPLARAGITLVILLALLGAVQTLTTGMALRDATLAVVFQAAGLLGLLAVGGAVVTALPLRAQPEGRSLLASLRIAGAAGLGRPMTTVAALMLTVAVVVGVVLVPPLLLVLGWVWATLVTSLSASVLEGRQKVKSAGRRRSTW